MRVKSKHNAVKHNLYFPVNFYNVFHRNWVSNAVSVNITAPIHFQGFCIIVNELLSPSSLPILFLNSKHTIDTVWVLLSAEVVRNCCYHQVKRHPLIVGHHHTDICHQLKPMRKQPYLRYQPHLSPPLILALFFVPRKNYNTTKKLWKLSHIPVFWPMIGTFLCTRTRDYTSRCNVSCAEYVERLKVHRPAPCLVHGPILFYAIF